MNEHQSTPPFAIPIGPSLRIAGRRFAHRYPRTAYWLQALGVGLLLFGPLALGLWLVLAVTS